MQAWSCHCPQCTPAAAVHSAHGTQHYKTARTAVSSHGLAMHAQQLQPAAQ
jgi:hypothetical protein